MNANLILRADSVTNSFQSEVEETIERIKVQGGVEGYVICNKQGQVLRRFPGMSLEDAEQYATTMISLTSQARGVVRDLDPKVNISDIATNVLDESSTLIMLWLE